MTDTVRRFTAWHKTPELLVATGAGLLAAVAADMASPTDLKDFYTIVVQVLPVFLVAFALEQSVTRAIGTETSYVNEAVARAENDYEPDGNWLSVCEAFAMLESSVQADARTSEIVFIGEDERALEMRIRNLPPADQWRRLVDAYRWRWARNLGTKGDAPASEGPETVEVRTARSLLPVFAYLPSPATPGVPTHDLLAGTVESRRSAVDAFARVGELFTKAVDEQREREKADAREAARRQYRARVFGRRLAAFVAIGLLAVAETIGLIGVLGDESLRSTLLPFVAGATAAVIVVVSAGAMRDLAAD